MLARYIRTCVPFLQHSHYINLATSGKGKDEIESLLGNLSSQFDKIWILLRMKSSQSHELLLHTLMMAAETDYLTEESMKHLCI